MPDNSKIAVLIVDDHPIVRQGLRTLLELQEDIELVGEAVNGKAAVELAAQVKPDVILMDIVMPVMDGITATRQIKAAGLAAHVIALTSFVEDERIIPAIQAGAASFLLKDVAPNELMEAIRAAYHGEARLHPVVIQKLMQRVAAHSPTAQEQASDLTEREMDVLRLIAQGMSNKEIAAALVISEKTVKTHVSSLLGKLDKSDRTQLAIFAIKKGLIPES